MPATTSAVALMSATLGVALSVTSSHCAKGCENAASPTMPLSTPIEVMPICTVDSHLVGCSCNSMATAAPRSWLSTITASRALREAVSAISDMANTPLSRIKKTSRATSIGLRDDRAPSQARRRA